MKSNFFILFAAVTVMAMSPLMSQEQESLEEVATDDLGNVTDQFQEYFFDALKQKGIENYEKAITALEACKKLDPKIAVVYFELGKNYKLLGKYELAASNLKKALELNPNKSEISEELIATYTVARDYENAIQLVKELSKTNPDYSEELANLYLLNEQYDNALKVLDDLDKKNGTSSFRNSMRNQIFARTNNTDAQIGNLVENIESDPENEKNYLNLIYIYSEQGQKEEAYNTALELLERNPGSTLVHLALYKFYLDKGQTEDAVRSMMKVFESEEIDTESKFKVLNDFLLFVDAYPKFEKELLKVTNKLNEWENTPKLYEQLGDYYLKKGKNEQALSYFELGLQQNYYNYDLLKRTLLLQLEFERNDEADTLSGEALESYPAQPIFYLLKGVALNNKEAYKDAEEILTFGLDYLIEDKVMQADFYFQLSKSLQGQGESKAAAEYYTKAENLLNESN